MRLFSTLYEQVMRWAAHKHASWYLAGLSFAESSFFPIPPDVMLAPMTLAKTHLAWRYAFITSVFSVLGGVLGYVIGMLLFDYMTPLLHSANYWQYFEKAQQWFIDYGVWAILIAGFSPIPYKVFTIAAGVVSMSFLPFIVASFIGRGLRFYLVAGLMVWGGKAMEALFLKYIERLGWCVIAVAALVIVFW